jgi:cytochrome c-type biogenesis protein CcmE
MKIGKMNISTGQLVATLVIVSSLVAIVMQATKQESSVTFFTPAEVYASPENFQNKIFRVSGLVLGGTSSWKAEEKKLRFRMTDLKGHEFNVTYTGIPPDLFKEGQGVVVEGKIKSANLKENNNLDAHLLMVKHSEMYDTKKDHSTQREAKLLDSITKGEQLPEKTMEKKY